MTDETFARGSARMHFAHGSDLRDANACPRTLRLGGAEKASHMA